MTFLVVVAVVDVAEVKDLDLDPELGILDEEAEAWVGTVDKKISKKLKEKEIKRQEHIYEFIITEKHHCLTLKVMQKVNNFVSFFLKFPLDSIVSSFALDLCGRDAEGDAIPLGDCRPHLPLP